MKYVIQIWGLLLCLLFSGCIVTKNHQYLLNPETTNVTPNNQNGVSVHLWLKEIKEEKKTVIPLVYTENKSKEPYQIVLSISGNFTDIEPISAEYIVNDQRHVAMKIARERWEVLDIKGGKKFIICDNIFDVPWDDIKKVIFKIQFYGINENEKMYFEFEQLFKPKYQSSIYSRFLE